MLKKYWNGKLGVEENKEGQKVRFLKMFLWNGVAEAIWEVFSVNGAWKKKLKGREKQNESMLIKDF